MANTKLRRAIERFNARDLAGAEQLCRSILKQAPRHPETLHLLGMVRLMSSDPREAAQLIGTALAADPSNASILEHLGLAQLAAQDWAAAETSFRNALRHGARHGLVHMRLGLALGSQGKLAEAVSALRKAVALAPDDPDVHLNLGNALAQSGDTDGAIACYRKVLELQPQHVDARFNLGTLLRRVGRLDEAVSEYLAALAQSPDYADAHTNLGLAYADQGRTEEAIRCFERALKIDERHTSARNNLGNIFLAQGRRDEAIACFAEALRYDPHHVEACVNLAAIRHDEGDMAAAEALYERALRASPRDADAHRGLAKLLMLQGTAAGALGHLKRVVELRPDNAESWQDLAAAFSQCGDFARAEGHYRRALALQPDDPDLHYGLGEALKVQGQLAEAARLQERALALKPDFFPALGSLVHLRQHMCAWEGIDALWQRVSGDAVGKAGSGISPFSLLSQPTAAQTQLVCAKTWANERFAALARVRERLAFDFSSRRSPHERLRVGYLSWDYHRHATAYLIAELFDLHDRTRFEIFAYDYGPDDGSAIRERIVRSCEHFVVLSGASDIAAAQRIYADDIDVLVDLKGYTLAARTEIMALRPAPIQVNWLGYPGTMGAPFIDYIVADPFIIPAGSESDYSEEVVRLPGCYQINDRHREVAATPSRGECGLPDDRFVFCCFNVSYKILPETFALWLRIMHAVPGSVLWLLDTNQWAIANLRSAAQAAGIDPERVLFAPRRPLAEHLARYHVADLALDTFPYTSHTTASDALWAGCPLITREGDTFASRVAGSVVRNAGLPELVVRSDEECERLAVHLASHREELTALRARLAEGRSACPLFDTPQFVRDLERAYERVAAGLNRSP
jgi:protein O-GlcNAc transferase